MGILAAVIAAGLHAIAPAERACIVVGVIALMAEISFTASPPAPIAKRIFLRGITLASLSYVGWMGSEPWFRMIEDSGWRDEARVEYLNRLHFIRGVFQYVTVVALTTAAVWPVPERHRPLRNNGRSRHLDYVLAFLLFVVAGAFLLWRRDSTSLVFALVLVGLELAIICAAIIAAKSRAFWAYAAQVALLGLVCAIARIM